VEKAPLLDDILANPSVFNNRSSVLLRSDITARVARIEQSILPKLFNPQEAELGHVTDMLRAVGTAADAVLAQGKQISANGDLSPQGKAAALKRAANEARKVAEPLATKLAAVDTQIATIRARAENEWAGKPRERGLEDFLAEQEIRKFLFAKYGTSLDPLMLFEPYIDAIVRRDVHFVNAIEKSPVPGLVNAQLLAAGRKLKIEGSGLTESIEIRERLRGVLSEMHVAIRHVANCVESGTDPNAIVHGG
jgi:hypothetical protein